MAAAASSEPAAEVVPPSQPLSYTIHSFSSHSAAFHPRNILLDQPSDQSSRWSSGSNNPPQFIVLELEDVAVLQEITFGKFEKQHVCNLKEFEVYGGLKTTNMIKLLSSGLKNDNKAETFSVLNKVSGVTMPVRYVKVVPLVAWGSRSAHFNFSIWHVALRGIAEATYVKRKVSEFQDLQAKEAVRLCLKYFRQRNYTDSFENLQKRTKIALEASVLTELYEALVKRGDFKNAEEILVTSLQGGVVHESIAKVKYTPEWTLLKSTRADGTLQDRSEKPGMRGGHQMCIDAEAGHIFLFGGWEGSRDLADFWRYDIATNQWRMLSADTHDDGGPDARSCHKMVFDPKTRKLYVLGKYVDSQELEKPLSDFHAYCVDTNAWTCVMRDTAAADGPALIYDHQMCVDSAKGKLYVFGGRVTSSQLLEHKSYSGLYRFDLATSTWTLLRADQESGPENCMLESRIGHSMLLDTASEELYIFAGQRQKVFFSDFHKYNIPMNTVKEVCPDCSKYGGPYPGFTQRATIDLDKREAYVLSGIIREPEMDSNKGSYCLVDLLSCVIHCLLCYVDDQCFKPSRSVRNSLWVYDIARDNWYCAYQNDNAEPEYWNKMDKLEPCPRFAHQFVYDHINKVHYLYGGNAGEVLGKHTRLSDFWRLDLHRPSLHDIIRRCRYLVRRQHFRELCVHSPREAMRFLREDLSSVVNHDDDTQSEEFQALAGSFFREDKGTNSTGSDTNFEDRTDLFEEVIKYFPRHMKQPQSNLVDLINMTEDTPVMDASSSAHARAMQT